MSTHEGEHTNGLTAEQLALLQEGTVAARATGITDRYDELLDEHAAITRRFAGEDQQDLAAAMEVAVESDAPFAFSIAV